MLVRTAVLLTLLTGPVLAQDYNRAELIRGLCQKDGCDEFQVLKAEPVLTGITGILKRTQVKTFHASHSGRVEREAETGYVYCSPSKPAVMAQGKSRTAAFMLAPFATEDSSETVRKNANFVAMYFAICHGPDVARRAVHDLRGTASSLGYRVAATASRMVELTTPEAIVDRAGPPPVAQAPRPQASRPQDARPAPAAPRREALPGPDLQPPGEIPEE
ncbi:hypothetical protein [Methylobacterium nonmethylotrophicum]|uniref:Uncharacterized protein n=1 Tax=Methylobacterium nonmethylotrophicum TaxID=1141884 RepID=A0A4Z0NJ14_9HYPH|nr:hypothetical protein [Methylobacterium nonmethylotrophicum]TGD95722.1 hypothetical protein EU555_26965 [Methylobacterium nonmethylotrophicum]